jgi:hypothetical protein
MTRIRYVRRTFLTKTHRLRIFVQSIILISAANRTATRGDVFTARSQFPRRYKN